MHSSLFQPFMTSAPILVVGDDPEFNQQLHHILTQAGYPLTTTANRAEALEKYEKQAPGLVLLDIMHAQTEGLALCQELRCRSAVPIILLASPNQDDAMIQGLDTGADDAIVSPFTADELAARIGALLRRLLWMATGNPPLAPQYLQTQTVTQQAGQAYVEGKSCLWDRLAPVFDAAN